MFKNLAYHSKPADTEGEVSIRVVIISHYMNQRTDIQQPQDKKTLALNATMTIWNVDHMSDLLPASIRPLAKTLSVAQSSDISTQPTVNDNIAPVFALPRD